MTDSRRKGASFNRTNDNIEWAQWTWNPVTGCKHGCAYCYARDIAHRFYGDFDPRFHPDRLAAPQNTKRPPTDADGAGRVFLCSMADLWGKWVPDKWIAAVLAACRGAPQWEFLALTKNPHRYLQHDIPENVWIGATADTQARADTALDAFGRVTGRHIRFLSCEPLTERVVVPPGAPVDWIIIGGQSKTTQAPAAQPDWYWVEDLLAGARACEAKVYVKPNMTARCREVPACVAPVLRSPTEAEREYLEEREGIRMFDDGKTKEEARLGALDDLARHLAASNGR